MAMPLANFKVGAAVRPTFRTQTSGSLTFTDILDLENSSVEEIARTRDGTGVGVDLGAIWNPSINLRFAATIQNIGGMGYLSGDDKPEVLRQESTIGMLYRMPFSKWEMNLLADFQNLENQDGIHWSRLLHMGAELGTKVFPKI